LPDRLLIAANDCLAGKIPVKAEGALPQEKIAHRVNSILINPGCRESITLPRDFGHFLPLDSSTSRGQKSASAAAALADMRKGRPVHRMKPDNVFADDVHISRPEGLKFFLRLRNSLWQKM